MNHLKYLFRPITIGNLNIKNRIVMPPMATQFGDSKGFVTDRLIAYYVERAKGGAGYITIEHTAISQDGRASDNMLMINTDEHIEGFRKLVDSIHLEGGKVFIQINHAGRQTASSITGKVIVAPSAVRCPLREETPKELSLEEINEIVNNFAEAAARVKATGADGVEIHMAHGYLLNQFLSPIVNKRKDIYGGSLQNRMRAPLDALIAVRKKVGKEFPISCRISAEEYIDGGLHLAESQKIAVALEKNGSNVIHVSACQASSPIPIIPHYYLEEGLFVNLATAIKQVVHIPVITVGRIRKPKMADQIIANGKADLVSMGRALISDPYLPQKAENGQLDEINHCISCNRCIFSSLKGGSIRCTVNPEVGRESWLKVEGKSENPKKVWIVGGGPAGLKAAQIAAIRGHEVSLFEKQKTLGGRLRLAALPPGKQCLQELINYLISQIEKLGVKINKGKPFDPKLLQEKTPDSVILATGSHSIIPKYCMGAVVVTDEQVLRQEVDVAQRVLILGGGDTGVELADYLCQKGKQVTILEMREGIGMDMFPSIRAFLIKRIAESGVSVLSSTKAVCFQDDCLLTEGPSGSQKVDCFEQIISSVGAVPNVELSQQIEKHCKNLYVIGDAKQPRDAMEAIFEAEEIALKI